MGKRPRHHDKEIEEAIAYAESKGWRLEKASGHAWGVLLCPYNDGLCRNGIFCRNSVWSTPKSSHNHARDIRKVVDGCTAAKIKEAENKE